MFNSAASLFFRLQLLPTVALVAGANGKIARCQAHVLAKAAFKRNPCPPRPLSASANPASHQLIAMSRLTEFC